MPTLLPVWAAWLLLATLLLAAGLAVYGEQAPAYALVQSETASPTTGTVTATTGVTQTPGLPPLMTPTITATPTATPSQLPPTPQPTASWTLTPSPTASPEPASTAPAETPSKTRRHYVRGDSNVVIQWGMLIDSLALGISWAWLVIGILVGVGLPILFVVLWIRTRRRQSAQE